MPVLSNVEIHNAIQSGKLIVEPRPGIPPGLPGSTYDEGTLTVHVGDSVHVPKKGLQLAFDLSLEGSIKETLDGALREVEIPEGGWVLKPNMFVLAKTHETIGFPLPEDGKGALMGRIEGRSKYARLGLLVHATAPTLQPNWTGQITFELKNLGYFPIILMPQSPIGQLVVEKVEGEVALDSGDFDRQDTATGSSS